jgi:hypothetical protein
MTSRFEATPRLGDNGPPVNGVYQNQNNSHDSGGGLGFEETGTIIKVKKEPGWLCVKEEQFR